MDLRNKNLSYNLLQVGVKILLKNEEGKYLLIRRSLEKYPEVKGRWDIVGGRIDPNETLLDALKREVKEETGLEIIDTPQLVAAQDIMIKEKAKHVVRLTYSGKTKGDKISLDLSENDMYRWLSWDELKSMDDLDKYFKLLLDDDLILSNK